MAFQAFVGVLPTNPENMLGQKIGNSVILYYTHYTKAILIAPAI